MGGITGALLRGGIIFYWNTSDLENAFGIDKTVHSPEMYNVINQIPQGEHLQESLLVVRNRHRFEHQQTMRPARIKPIGSTGSIDLRATISDGTRGHSGNNCPCRNILRNNTPHANDSMISYGHPINHADIGTNPNIRANNNTF